MKLIRRLLSPTIADPDKIREWKLNAFYRLIAALIIFLAIPLCITFLVMGHASMFAVSLGMIVILFPFFIMLRRGIMAPTVNLFLVISILFDSAFICVLGINDSAYVYFFDTLIAGIFLSFNAAVIWAGLISGSLVLLSWLLPKMTVLPSMVFFNHGYPIINTHGTHFSTAIFLIWSGALLSLLFERYFRDLIFSLINSNGKLKDEIAERTKAEAQARAAHQFSNQIISSAGEGIVVCDRDLHCLVWNHTMEAMTGIMSSQALGVSITLHIPVLNDPIIRNHMYQALGGETVRTAELAFTVPETRRKGFLIGLFSPHKGNNGTIDGMVAIFRDITEQKELEENLRQSHKLESIGQLAGGVAHDFNNQLSGILGYAEMIRKSVGDKADLSRWADNVIIGVRRAADLTSKLLAFARKGKYQSIPVNMHGIIFEVVGILERSIDKQIEIKQHLDANPSTTLGDPTQLQNALLNLAINARDAMPRGGSLLFTTSVATLDMLFCKKLPFDIEPGDYLKLTVEDTGIGMTDEIKRRVFEPFFTTKEPGKGTGMGLAALYGTMKTHHGAIVVDSTPGVGTTFTLYLPLCVENEDINATKCDGTDGREGSAHVMIVDDEDLIREFATEILNSAGYQVKTCADGIEAVSHYKHYHQTIDCVVLDLIMPRMNGREVLAELRRINPNVRVILSSGYGLEEDTSQLLANDNIVAFITKPYRDTDLFDAIERSIGKKGKTG
ncbi:MAG: response regulator [Chitinispirillaceae bacterium]|nr:response regulator [Chitinispirillaceae bacterium]